MAECCVERGRWLARVACRRQVGPESRRLCREVMARPVDRSELFAVWGREESLKDWLSLAREEARDIVNPPDERRAWAELLSELEAMP